MEPLGKKLQEARLRKKISLEEASRVTKIRASRIQEIENDDFSSFSSLAYAKGFILIYGKYLDVDVTPYLEAFETSREVSVDGYSYLQESPTGAPPPLVRRQPTKRPTLVPFIIAVGVLVLGLYLVRLLLNIQRIAPHSPGTAAIASSTPTPSPTPAENIVAPRAQPVEGTPASEAHVAAPPAAAPVSPSGTAPEVRRAQPVHPEDFSSPSVSPNENATTISQIEIKPVRQTYLRVQVDGSAQPAFDDWFDPSHAPLAISGHHLVVRVLDRGAVQIKKNGAPLADGDGVITFE
jgi:cytoskeletal protein RodZ